MKSILLSHKEINSPLGIPLHEGYWKCYQLKRRGPQIGGLMNLQQDPTMGLHYATPLERITRASSLNIPVLFCRMEQGAPFCEWKGYMMWI